MNDIRILQHALWWPGNRICQHWPTYVGILFYIFRYSSVAMEVIWATFLQSIVTSSTTISGRIHANHGTSTKEYDGEVHKPTTITKGEQLWPDKIKQTEFLFYELSNIDELIVECLRHTPYIFLWIFFIVPIRYTNTIYSLYYFDKVSFYTPAPLQRRYFWKKQNKSLKFLSPSVNMRERRKVK